MRVALIEDDAAVLDSLRLYLKRQGVTADCFPTADEFLAAGKPAVRQYDCVIADVRMPGVSGLDLVRHFAAEAIDVPTILITGHGDIGMAVTAIKDGAFDFIEKPFDESRLLESIQNAVKTERRKLDDAAELADLEARLAQLSERQRQVMALAVAGLSNKDIGQRLRISFRTVEVHRAWMMNKMGARNLAELVRMGMQLKSQLLTPR